MENQALGDIRRGDDFVHGCFFVAVFGKVLQGCADDPLLFIFGNMNLRHHHHLIDCFSQFLL
ncbi:hypothetical protein [Desulfitobacterium hafniense]|uniref:hypothetical protein n=1 Tax=Desulfitobacterium hafniense TaxID=49338 RepID=UPI0002D8E692|nr:hypothetical protein [Desulfitobacterium hafniense]